MDLEALLAELKASGDALEQHRSVMDAEGNVPTKEQAEKWDALVADHEKVKAKVDATREKVESAAAREKRSAYAASVREDADRFDKEFIRNPNYDPRRDSTTGKRARVDPDVLVNEAFTAWAMGGRPGKEIPRDLLESAARCGVNPGHNVFEMPTDARTYTRFLRAFYADVTHHNVYRAQGLSVRDFMDRYSAVANTPYLDSRVPDGAGLTNVGPTFMGGLERNIISYGGIFNAPITVRTIPGYEDLVRDFADDQNEGYQIGEGHPLASGKNPKFGQIKWGAWDYSSGGVIITERQLEVSRYDLEDFIGDVNGERLGRVQARKFTWGTGAAEPMGLATAAVKGGKKVMSGAVGVIDQDDIRNLEYALDEAFIAGPDVGFMMNRGTIAILEQLVDTTGRPLFQLGQEAGTNRRTLRGRSIYTNYQLPLPATGKIPILFGAFGKYVVARRGRGTPRVIRDPYSLMNELKLIFTTILSADGKLEDYGNCPIAYLQVS
jgi:HK97 family phage major capsid protein